MQIRKEVISHIFALFIGSLVLALALRLTGLNLLVAILISGSLFFILTGYLLWFFRDPERMPPGDDQLIVSAADGVVTGIQTFSAPEFRKICLGSGLKESVIIGMTEFAGNPVIRISVFLSLTDVHVNRAPMHGKSEFLGYFPGKHLFTMNEKSSEVNQHNAIRIVNRNTGCLIFQIVGPVARRVVYWPDKQKAVPILQGERIGMMKFGSRLDLYLPENHVNLLIAENETVVAGVTPVAEIKKVKS